MTGLSSQTGLSGQTGLLSQTGSSSQTGLSNQACGIGQTSVTLSLGIQEVRFYLKLFPNMVKCS